MQKDSKFFQTLADLPENASEQMARPIVSW